MAKWINCKKCSHEYHSSLPRCPECGAATPSLKNIAVIAGALALCVVVVVGFILGINDKGDIDAAPSKSEPTSASEDKTSNDTSVGQEPSDSSLEDNSNSATPSQSTVQDSAVPKPQTTEQIPTIGTKQIGDYYYSTLPKYYLDYSYKIYKAFYPETTFEDYAYKLNDEQKANGNEEIIKNKDGSATYKIHKSKVSERTANMLIALIELRAELKKYDYISAIEQDKNFNITVTLTTNEPDSLQKYNIVMLGLRNFENQLFTVSENKANVIIKFPNGSEEIIKFPDDIK